MSKYVIPRKVQGGEVECHEPSLLAPGCSPAKYIYIELVTAKTKVKNRPGVAAHPPPLCQVKDPTPLWHSPSKSQYEVEFEHDDDNLAKYDGFRDDLANVDLVTFLFLLLLPSLPL